MPTNSQLDAPLTLAGLFPPDDSDDEDDTDQSGVVDPYYEIQELTIVGEPFRIRQFDYHSHNANQVWPGTFNLAEYLLARSDEDSDGDASSKSSRPYANQWGRVLELGTATGLLAMRLVTARRDDNNTDNAACIASITTSDVDDERGEVSSNLTFNYDLNDIAKPHIVHIPHTWGTGWEESCRRQEVDVTDFDTIVASDILLYVSAYAALVETLLELMKAGEPTKFVMSWNRRMKESSEFFDRMKDAGFQATHEGNCIYTFVRSDNPTALKNDILYKRNEAKDPS